MTDPYSIISVTDYKLNEDYSCSLFVEMINNTAILNASVKDVQNWLDSTSYLVEERINRRTMDISQKPIKWEDFMEYEFNFQYAMELARWILKYKFNDTK